ncbi:hypothetical protein D3C78_1266490 [compost metagenome]
MQYRGKMNDMGGAMRIQRLLQQAEVGDVTLDEIHTRQLRVVHQQTQTPRVAGRIEGRDRHAFADKLSHNPRADAAHCAGHQKAFSAAHWMASWLEGIGLVAGISCRNDAQRECIHF